MALANKTWTEITVHEMVVAWLQAEKVKFTIKRYRRIDDLSLRDKDMELIDNPDINNPLDNHRRLRLLNIIRAPLLAEIPPDTKWYKVSNLQDKDLAGIRTIARCDWDDKEPDEDARDQNELLSVSKRKPGTLKTSPSEWTSPILWGHTKDGPFTIIEGNNRLTGYASQQDLPPLDIPVIIGLSPTPFYFHIPDPAHFVANDLWRKSKKSIKGWLSLLLMIVVVMIIVAVRFHFTK